MKAPYYHRGGLLFTHDPDDGGILIATLAPGVDTEAALILAAAPTLHDTARTFASLARVTKSTIQAARDDHDDAAAFMDTLRRAIEKNDGHGLADANAILTTPGPALDFGEDLFS